MPQYIVRSRYGAGTRQTVDGELEIRGVSGELGLILEAVAPRLSWVETDASADNGRWDILVNVEALLFRVFNDDGSAGTTWMQVDRTLNVIDLILLNHPVQVGTFGANGTVPIARPSVTGSRGANAALASLLTALDNYGLITDNTVI